MCFSSSILTSKAPVALQKMCVIVTACYKNKKETKFIIIWTATFFKQGKSFLYWSVLIKYLLDCCSSWKSPSTPDYFQQHFVILYSGWAEIPLTAKKTSCAFILNCIFWFHSGSWWRSGWSAPWAEHCGVCRLVWLFIQSREDNIDIHEFCLGREHVQIFSGPVINLLKDSKAT